MIIEAIGAAISVAGFFTSQDGANDEQAIRDQQAGVSRRISNLTKRQEELRKQQARFDYIFQKRQMIKERQLAIAQGQVASSANSGGGSIGTSGGGAGGSAYAGAYGTAVGNSSNNLTNLFQNFRLGQRNFALNARIGDAQSEYNRLGSQISGAQGDQQLGQSLFQAGTSTIQYSNQIGATISGLAPSLFRT